MKQRGRLTLVFDDGYTDVFSGVVPLLRTLQLPAVFAVPLKSEHLSQESHLPVTPWEQWRALASEEVEIAAHSVSHTNLTKVSPGQLEEELRTPAQSLGATTFVYPGGAHNDAVVQEVARHYTAARTTHKGFERLTPVDPYRLHTYNFTQKNFTVAKANLLALLAYLRNIWLIETFHHVGDSAGNYPYTVTQKELSQHLRFVKKLPLAVQTIQGAVGGWRDGIPTPRSTKHQMRLRPQEAEGSSSRQDPQLYA